MTAQLLLGVSLFAWLVLDVCGLSVKGLQSQHQSSSSSSRGGGGGSSTSAGGNVAFRRASSGSSDPAGVFMQQPSRPQSVQPVFVGVSAVPAAGYAAGSAPAGYYSGAPYIPGSAAGSPQAAAGQSSLPESKWTIQDFEEASSAQAQSPSAPLSPPVTLQSGETSKAELGNYHHQQQQQQMEEFGYPAGRMWPGQSLPLVTTPNLGVGGLWGYSSLYPRHCPFPYPYFDYRLLYGLYPPGTYNAFSRNDVRGKNYYRPGTMRQNMALMLHKWPRTLEQAEGLTR
ncbi:uncharacterized protein LOC129362845 [Poeciliopsis prolifica]|uniref:uncharacterized protein LOC129362845 n=1 Tax=Poeciliopsis prolifica TaxID=188132 RepID=UPI0024138628|nr:uncharacterized protein LOC129362845 [Poeciliopsis prolifica]